MKKEALRIGGLAKIKKQKIQGIFEDVTFVFNAKPGDDDWGSLDQPTQIPNGDLMDGFLRDLELFYPAFSDKVVSRHTPVDGEFLRGLSFAESIDFATACEDHFAIVIDGPIMKKAPEIYYEMFPSAKRTTNRLRLYKIFLGKRLYWIHDEHLESPY